MDTYDHSEDVLPELLKKYLLATNNMWIINEDSLKKEKTMVQLAQQVLELICDNIDLEALKWFYHNWINTIPNFMFTFIIENIIDEINETDDSNLEIHKFINFYINNICIDDTKTIMNYRKNH